MKHEGAAPKYRPGGHLSAMKEKKKSFKKGKKGVDKWGGEW